MERGNTPNEQPEGVWLDDVSRFARGSCADLAEQKYDNAFVMVIPVWGA
jgi:hypothetical protein